MKRLWLVLGGILILSFIAPAPSQACTLEGKTFCGKHVYRCNGKDPHRRGYNDIVIVGIGETVSDTVLKTGQRTDAAMALAIDTGRGDDRITINGKVVATAGVTLTASDQGENGNGAGKGTKKNDSLTGTATATGIASGDSDRTDRVVNNGRIDVTATADVTRPKVLFDNTSKSAGQSGKGSSGAPGIIAQGVNIPTRSEAFATGIDAGSCGLDEITNTGKLYVTSSATTRVNSIELNLADSSKVNASVSAFSSATGILGAGSVTSTGWIIVTAGSEANIANIQGTLGKNAEANVSTSAESVARGISGSAGGDTLITSGILSADATSLAEGRLNLEQSRSDVTLNASVTATATSTGIDGGAGDDTIGNTSSLTVSATSTARAPTIGKDAFASGVTDATVSAVAEAAAMKGGSGADTLTNSKTVSATSTAGAGLLSFMGSIIAYPQGTDLKGGATSRATATGIDGGEQRDTITNTGTVSASATATTETANILVTLAGGGIFSTPTSASSESIGIEGGRGSDTITNGGTVTSTARAEATGTGVSVSGVQLEVVTDGESRIDATAKAWGVKGGSGRDVIVNTGTVTATGTAKATSRDISVEILGMSSMNAATTAEATATGIDGGKGADSIENAGTVNANATSTANALGVDVKYKGIPLDVFGVKVGDSRTASRASAVGIEGGAGADTITNTGSVNVTARATVETDKISAQVSFPLSTTTAVTAAGVPAAAAMIVAAPESPDQPDAPEVSPFNSGTTAEAKATGISGGSGADTITNSKLVDTLAYSEADSVSVKAAISYQKGGALSLLPNVGLTNAKTGAGSAANGIDGGAGSDTIENTGTVKADAQANATSAVVGVTFTGTKGSGAALGGTIANATTEAVSTAAGIQGGSGDDTITNTGRVTATATSDADSGTVTASVEGAKEGLIVGFTHADARTTATATATGIDGGAGNDVITHAATGVLEATSNAMATNVVVGATVAGSVSQEWSLSASGAITKGTTEATANSWGIEGGDGNDTITNAGKTTVHATADSDGGSISANVSGVEDGLAVGFTYADHSTKATATAGGLTGGAGDDTIRHTATETLSVTADALASSTKVGVTVTGATKGTGIVGGAAITDGTTTATSRAAGITGGDGNDRIASSGPVTVASNSTANSASVSVNLGAAGGELGLVGGFSYASATTTAESTAVGIDGGAGDDRIRNTASLTVTSTPVATSGVVGVTAQGVKGMGAAVGIGVTDGSTKATASATGISGGDGDDLVVNTNTITVKSLPDANSTKVTVTISAAKEGVAAGGALAIGTTTSEAHATGIDGGSGSDRVVNRGTIDTTAYAEASSAHVGVSAEGTMTGVAAGVALSDGTTKAISDAAGIRGGEGDDVLRNTNKITATSTSDIAGASVSVHLGGAQTGLVAGLAAADLSVTAGSEAVGIDGGSGNDRIVNQGTVTATALSDIASASVSVIAGVAVSGVAAGAALAKGDTTAASVAGGLKGGDGADRVVNSGTLIVSATSDVKAASVGVSLQGTQAGLAAGVSAVDGQNRTSALAVGLDGGAGDDVLRNEGTATVTATANSTRTNVAVTGTLSLDGVAAGASFAKASNTALSDARGMDGGQGSDRIVNTGTLTTDATTTAQTNTVSVTIGIAVFSGLSAGAAVASSETTATSLAAGLSGGDGCDVLRNGAEGAVQGLSTATVTAKAISVNVSTTGFASAKLSTTSLAYYTGMTGGSGSDALVNEGLVDVKSVSTGNGTAGSGTLTGYGAADVSIAANATAIGMDGGADGDWLKNEKTLKAVSEATATGRSVSVSLIGGASAKGQTNAQAESVGASGGDGENTIVTKAGSSITGTAISTATMGAVSINIVGGVKAEAGSTAASAATGLAGGKDADTIRNEGAMTLTATSTSKASGKTIQLIGGGNSNAKAVATATAAGIAGGDGENTLANLASGNINAQATATGDASSYKIDLAGAGSATAGTEASATALGIAGGKDADTIRNEGSITAGSSATLTATSKSYEITGVGIADASTDAVSTATGIDGADGENRIVNRSTGSLTVTSSASATSTGVTASIGINGALAGSAAQAHSIGLKTGSGDDTIVNEGSVTVSATSSARAENGNLSLAGLSFGNAASQATADGISAGDGNDTVVNRGTLTVAPILNDTTPMAKGSGVSASLAFFELSFSNFGAKATANGILGGGGDDRIVNQGSITVGSEHWMARGDATGLSGAFLSLLSLSSAGAGAKAYSTGISGGDGNDRILNDEGALLSVKASSYALGGNSTDATLGRTQGASGSDTVASAAGISGGAGDNRIENRGVIDVLAKTYSEASSTATAGWGKPIASAEAVADAAAVGIDAGAGKNTIVNDGQLTVRAEATAYAHSWAEEDSGSLADEDAKATATATSKAWGITTGDGGNRIVNNGSIIVTATAKPDAIAETEDNDVERRTPSGTASAWGIKTGTGDDRIVIGEQGSLQVNALGQTGTTMAGLSAVGIDAGPGDNRLDIEGLAAVTASQANAVTLLAADNVSALGIQAGTGDDRIAIGSTGSLIVDALSTAAVLYGGSGTTIARGIEIGSGNNRLDILGRLQVSALHAPVSLSSSGEAVAKGVIAGAGDDRIGVEKSGLLTVRATSSPTGFIYLSAKSSATGIDAGEGSNRVEIQGRLEVTAESGALAAIPINEAQALGIRTGSGADVIVNEGAIVANEIRGGVVTPGTAIHAGAGNDRVRLGSSSVTVGAIDLGDGDDSLTLAGAPQVTGFVTGGAGTNTLVFDGAGGIAFAPVAFQQATKQGSGTFSVATLPTMQRIDVRQGVLQVNGSYAFSNTGVFRSRINGDGSFGQFKVNGKAQLDGSLTVVKGTGLFVPGRTYSVVEASTLTNAFSSVSLPASNCFVSFRMNQLPTAVQVETTVKPFTSQAGNPAQNAVSAALDRIVASGTASEDLTSRLGLLQDLSPSRYRAAVSTISADSYGNFSQSSVSTAHRYTKSLQYRMQNVRSMAGQQVQEQPILLAYVGSDMDLFYNFDRVSQVQGKNGLWVNAFGQWGAQQQENGYAGYDYSMSGVTVGFDRVLGNGFLAGLSAGYAKSDVDLDDGQGNGDIESYYASLYGSWSLKDLSVDTVLSVGRNRYDNNRLVAAGGPPAWVVSSHDGDLFSGYLRAGYTFRVQDWALEPFASAQYVFLDEDAFIESGAAGLSLNVDSRTTQSLVSELGLRVTRVFSFDYGKLVPEVSVAWLHDFDIDDRVITSSFAGSPGATFAVAGPKAQKDGAAGGAGITFVHKSGFSTSIKYIGEYRGDYISNGVLGELRFVF